MKICFIDLETTGFSREWDYIIEVAAVLTENGKEIDSFHEYIKPGKTIPYNIVELTGITNEQVKNCDNESQVLSRFIRWLKGYEIDYVVGHNYIAFDGGFLLARTSRYGYEFPSFKIIDTLRVAKEANKTGKICTPNNKQPTLAQYFKINYEAHSAIEDVRALIKIFEQFNFLGCIKYE